MVQDFSARVRGWAYRLRISPTMLWLILINLLVYVLVGVSSLLSPVGLGALPPAYDFLALPASLGRLLVRPWTLVTYMFFHLDFWHILWNLVWFWAFGRLFSLRRDAPQLLALYLLGGLGGGLLYVVAFNVLPAFQGVLPVSSALGASASIMAVTVAAALDSPNHDVYLYGVIRIKVKWIAVLAVGIDLLSMRDGNAGGHIAHLGGALVGLLFHMGLSRGMDPSRWLRRGAWHRSGARRSARGPKVHSRRPTPPTTPSPEAMQRILEKLRHGGYGALTSEEREELFRKRT